MKHNYEDFNFMAIPKVSAREEERIRRKCKRKIAKDNKRKRKVEPTANQSCTTKTGTNISSFEKELRNWMTDVLSNWNITGQ